MGSPRPRSHHFQRQQHSQPPPPFHTYIDLQTWKRTSAIRTGNAHTARSTTGTLLSRLHRCRRLPLVIRPRGSAVRSGGLLLLVPALLVKRSRPRTMESRRQLGAIRMVTAVIEGPPVDHVGGAWLSGARGMGSGRQWLAMARIKPSLSPKSIEKGCEPANPGTSPEPGGAPIGTLHPLLLRRVLPVLQQRLAAPANPQLCYHGN